MAIYNLYDGGTDMMKPCACCDKDKLDDKDLPLFVQPDLRVHGGYGFRHKTNWKYLMLELLRRYGKHPQDLEVGDKLRIFIQPNHATMRSVGVDFKKPSAGFEFKLQSVRELSFHAELYESSYDPVTMEVKSESTNTIEPTSPFGASVAANTQYNFIFYDRPHTAKVDAVELEITALPVSGLLPDMDLWFVRRFSMDGLHI